MPYKVIERVATPDEHRMLAHAVGWHDDDK